MNVDGDSQALGQSYQSDEARRNKVLRNNDRRVAIMWLAPAVLGAVVGIVIGAVVALVVPFGWLIGVLLVIVGTAAGALAGAKTVAKSESWLRDAVGLSRALPATEQDHPRLHNLLESLCLSTGVDLEEVLILDQPQVNLLTLGSTPHSTTLLLTRGLVESLDRIETEALLALALGKIRDDHTTDLTMILRTVGLPSVLVENTSSGLVRLIARPALWFTSRRLSVALAGHDDIDADLLAAGITRYPPGLIAALEKASEIGTNVVSGLSVSPTLSALWLLAPDAASPNETGSTTASSDATPLGRASLQLRIQVLREL